MHCLLAGRGERCCVTHQRGVALIMVLLVTAIIAIIGMEVATRQQLDIRRTSNVLHSEQAFLFALGAEFWARGVLQADARDTDALTDDWAKALSPIVVEGARMTGAIEDLQGRFNLNNLVREGQASEPDIKRFSRLLKAVGLAPALAPALADWLDTDQEPRFPDGAEDGTYLRREVAYRTADGLMSSPSELLLVQGLDPNDYQALAPFVAALPKPVPINVNTAPVEVLMSLAEGLSAEDAKSLAAGRGRKGYASINEFLAREELAGRVINPADLCVASEFFLVTIQSDFGRGQAQLLTVLRRDEQGMEALMRAQGVY